MKDIEKADQTLLCLRQSINKSHRLRTCLLASDAGAEDFE